ncbi:MAG TPA: hypothetical protein VM118_14400 [Acidobacteriota bacterium]|nr:hypothetical protein [Acidobacteriota bacterium]
MLDPEWRSKLTTDQIIPLEPGGSLEAAVAIYATDRERYRAILLKPGTHHWNLNQWVRFGGLDEQRPLIIASFDPVNLAMITRDLAAGASESECESGGRALFNVVAPFVALTEFQTSMTGAVAHFQTHHHEISRVHIGDTQCADVVTLHDTAHEGGFLAEYLYFGPSTNWLLDGQPYHGGTQKVYAMIGVGKQKYPVTIRNIYGENGTGYMVQVSGCDATVSNIGGHNTRGFISAHTRANVSVTGSIWVRDGIPQTILLPKTSGEAFVATGGAKISAAGNELYLQHPTAIGPIHGLAPVMDFAANTWEILSDTIGATWDNATSMVDVKHRFVDDQGALVDDEVLIGPSTDLHLAISRARALADWQGVVPEPPDPEPPVPEPPVDETLVQLTRIADALERLADSTAGRTYTLTLEGSIT